MSELQIGVIVGLKSSEQSLGEVKTYGLSVCQLASWEPELWTSEVAKRILEESKTAGVRISAFWAGWPGPRVWDLIDGPGTLGIVPKEYRQERMGALRLGGAFAKEIGVPAVITHLGFIPENPKNPVFEDVVGAVRELGEYFKGLGIGFWFETGQETPVTMLRLIKQVGLDNLGINLDPANLIMYGKGNPIDALGVFGRYVRNVHVKDGVYPSDPMKLGKEMRVGEGQVCYPEFVRRLSEIGFPGDFIIEREVSGEEQRRDIEATIKYLKKLGIGI